MKGMTEVRMMMSDRSEDDLEIRDADSGIEDGAIEDGATWRQQQLLPTPPRPSRARPATNNGDRPSDRLRQAGLVGIAQAREALADAARRAKARAESRAA
jgi:hypothetical protein